VELLFVCLAAHVLEFPRWTPGIVKLWLPPRHSRGVSFVRLGRAVPIDNNRAVPIDFYKVDRNFSERLTAAPIAERVAILDVPIYAARLRVFVFLVPSH